MLEGPAKAIELVGIIPAVGVKRVREHGRAKEGAHLLPCLPDLQPIDLVRSNVIALIDVELVNAQSRDPGATCRHQCNGGGAEQCAHLWTSAAKNDWKLYHSKTRSRDPWLPFTGTPPPPNEAMSTQHDLKNAGLKATLPRLKIINLFEQSKVRHLTAEDVYKQLLAEGLDVGLATVYRVLTQFEQAGLLVRHHFESGKAVFELNQGGHHDHLVCLQCGRVEEFFDAEIEKRQTRIARERGFEISEHALYLYAECTRVKCPYRKSGGHD